MLAVILIIVAGLSSFFYLSRDKTTDTGNSSVEIEKTEPIDRVLLTALLVTAEGVVEVKTKDGEEWTPAAADTAIDVGGTLKAGEASSAVLQFPGDDFLVLSENSEIKIEENTSSSIVISQMSGTTYHRVVERDNFTYVVTKDDAKATALGTEFSITISSDEIYVSAFKHRVKFEHKHGQTEIDELNQVTYNIGSGNYESKLIGKPDEVKQPFIALIDKASEIINQKKLAAEEAAKRAAEETVKKEATTSTAQSTGQNTGNQPSSNTSAQSNSTASADSAASSTANSGDSAASSDNQSGQSSSTPAPASTTEAPAQTIFGDFSTTSVESIVNSLGLVLNDAVGDWSEPGGGGPPEGVYHYDPIDLDNLYMGIRDGRLYIKWSLSGTIPDLIQTIDGDTVVSVVYNIGIDNDGDSGDSCGGSETHLQINVQYHDNGQIWYNPWFNAGCLSGEGEHDAVYETNGSGLAHTYNSGLGKTTIVYSYALSDLADTISVGSNLKLDISSEAESKAWHHYSYDQNQILGQRTWVDWTAVEI